MFDGTVLVNYTGRTGGGPIFAHEMTKGLIDNGVKVIAIISDGVENLSEWKKLDLEKLVCIKTYSNKVNYLFNTLLFGVRQKKSILRELRTYNISAIYCPMWCQWTKRVNEIFPNVSVYETLHDPHPHSGEKKYLKKYEPSLNTKKLIVLSEQFRVSVEERYGKPTLWIPHGRFDYYKKKYFKGYERSNKINYLFMGRIEEYKGLRVLAHAFELVKDKLKNPYTLTIAGRGKWEEYADEFKNISGLNVLNKWLSDEEINDLYSKENTVTILPYIDATQSGVVAVAMEYQSPIIASDAGGLKEQIIDGVTGYLFKAGDENALAEAILTIDRDFGAAVQMAENAFSRLSDLDWDKLALKLLNDLSGGEL